MLKPNRRMRISMLIVLAVSLLPLAAVAAVSGTDLWTTTTEEDFNDATLDRVDTWTQPGSVQLDHVWALNSRVNDTSSQSKFGPDITALITHTASTSGTLFVATWADERDQDHNPDIYIATSADGALWSGDVLVSGAHVNDIAKTDPAIAARAVDDSLWIVWHDTTTDDGDIYYGYSTDEGANWSSSARLYAGPGTQHSPDLAYDGDSDDLIAAWEDERSDAGDIHVARGNPGTGLVWSEHRADDGPASSEQANPAIAVDSDGNVYLAWEDYRDDPDGTDPHVYFASWMAGGTWSTADWSAATRLSDESMDWAASPSIIAADDDTLYAAWMERVPTGPATYDFQIVVAYSADQGTTWSRQVVERVIGSSGSSNAFVTAPSLETDANGTVYVVWLYSPDSQAATASVWFAQSPDGGTTWTEPVAINAPGATVDVDTEPVIAVDESDSTVVAVWGDFREGSSTQIYASRYPGARYAAQGTWTRTFDAGVPASWDRITWTATIPAQTSLQVATRVLDGSSWTSWNQSSPSGTPLTHPDARLLQVRARFTSTLSLSNDTAILDEIVVSYTPYDAVYLPLVLR